MASDLTKIIGVINDDPYNVRTWSGSSSFLFQALKKKDVLVAALSAKPSKLVNCLSKLVSFNPNFNRWKFNYHTSLFHYKLMELTVKEKIKRLKQEFNCVLQIGAWYDLTELKNVNLAVTSYHDGNFAALAKSPYMPLKISKRYERRLVSYEKKVYDKLDIIFCFSKWLADSFHNDFGIKYKKIKVVGSGVNLNYSVNEEIKQKDYSKPNLLFVGVNFERKGGRYLIEAFKKVKKVIPEVRLKIVTMKKYHVASIDKNIEFIDIIDKSSEEGIKQIKDLYLWASVFLLPSIYEPFGIALLEAMLFKTACIGTKVCAIPEIITDGVTGYIVPPLDSDELTKRILDIIKDKKVAESFAKNGHDKVKDVYSWDKVVDHMILEISKIK